FIGLVQGTNNDAEIKSNHLGIQKAKCLNIQNPAFHNGFCWSSSRPQNKAEIKADHLGIQKAKCLNIQNPAFHNGFCWSSSRQQTKQRSKPTIW
ncbi:hypothetical protein AMTR_s00857p00010290, partial [Amborella trichopoda]